MQVRSILCEVLTSIFRILAGSVSTLNTIRRDRQSVQTQAMSGVTDNDPFSLKNSTREFRTRSDKVLNMFSF